MGGASASAEVERRWKAEAIPIMLGTTAMGNLSRRIKLIWLVESARKNISVFPNFSLAA
jgi:hypothetical protein